MKDSLRAPCVAFCFTLLFPVILYAAGCGQRDMGGDDPSVNGLLVLDHLYGANYLLIRDVFEQ